MCGGIPNLDADFVGLRPVTSTANDPEAPVMAPAVPVTPVASAPGAEAGCDDPSLSHDAF